MSSPTRTDDGSVDNSGTGTAASARLDRAKMRKIATASVIGTTVEWYDLFLFGTASALVFNQVFFPELSPALGTILAFLTFAAAYLARTVGAVLFGHFGDRLGRKSMLLVSLLVMGGATLAIGLVPDFNTIGIAAPFILLTLRIIQGLALGGEWGGAVLMTVEHAPEERRGWYGSMVQVGVPVGTLLANLAFLIVTGLVSEEALISWGWRVPFIASVLLVAVGIYIRLNIEETPSFQQVREQGAKAKLPFAHLMRHYWKPVILGGVATLSTGSTFTLMVASGVNYGTQEKGLSSNFMLWVVLVACIIGLIFIPVFGRLSDKVGRRPIIAAGIAGEVILAFPFFWLINTGSARRSLPRLRADDDRLLRELRTDRDLPRRALRREDPLLRTVRVLHALGPAGLGNHPRDHRVAARRHRQVRLDGLVHRRLRGPVTHRPVPAHRKPPAEHRPCRYRRGRSQR